MSRFVIRWDVDRAHWSVVDRENVVVAASFPTLLEAETYVIERGARSES